MAKRILKYELDIRLGEVWMPATAEVKFVGTQGSKVYLWAEVDDQDAPILRSLRIFGTGHPLPNSLGAYIGTVQQDLPSGQFVWHIYEPGDE